MLGRGWEEEGGWKGVEGRGSLLLVGCLAGLASPAGDQESVLD